MRQTTLLTCMAVICLILTVVPVRAEDGNVPVAEKPVFAGSSVGTEPATEGQKTPPGPAPENTPPLKPAENGLPGPPVRLEISPDETRAGDILSFAGSVVASVLDAGGNPVPDVAVQFSAGLENADCVSPSAHNQQLRFVAPADDCLVNGFPTYDRCGTTGPFCSRTDAGGRAAVYVILGGVPQADYMVTAAFTDQDGNSVTGTARFHSTEVADWVCKQNTSPGGHLVVFQLPYEDGICCGAAGETIDLWACLQLIIEKEKKHIITCDNDLKCPHIYGIREFTTDYNYDEDIHVSFEAEVVFNNDPGKAVQVGSLYKYPFTITPGVNSVPVTYAATLIRDVTFTPCESCRISRLKKRYHGSETVMVYGISTGFIDDQGAAVSEVNVPVNEKNLAEQETVLTIQVDPAEYIPADCSVIIYQDNTAMQRIPVEIVDGRGRVAIEAGFAFDEAAAYTAGIRVEEGPCRSLKLETPEAERLTIKPFHPVINANVPVAAFGRIVDRKKQSKNSPQLVIGFTTRFISPDEQEKIKTCCRQEGLSYFNSQGSIFENAPLIFTKEADVNKTVVVCFRQCRISSDHFIITEMVDASTGVLIFYDVNKLDASENACMQYIRSAIRKIENYDKKIVAEKLQGIRLSIGGRVFCNDLYSEFIQSLFDNSNICLLERMIVDDIIDIQNMNYSGRVSKANKLEMGKLKGSDFVCLVKSVDETDLDDLLTPDNEISFNAIVVNVEDGAVVYRQTIASLSDIGVFIDRFLDQLKHQQ